MQKNKKIGIIVAYLVASTVIIGAILLRDKKPIPSNYDISDFTQITHSGSGWDFHSSISNNGEKICFARYNPSTSELSLNLYSIENDTTTTVVSSMTGDFSSTWSPDDSKIAFDARENDEATSYIYILTIATGEIVKFSSINGNSFRPDWSHDGESIVFVCNLRLYIQPISGGDAVLIPNADQAVNPSWNHDDTKILFCKESATKDIYSIDPDGSNLTFLAKGNSNHFESWAKWSNDSTHIIYHFFFFFLFLSNILFLNQKRKSTNLYQTRTQ